MKYCTVSFDPSLTPEQEHELVRAIKNFRGVSHVDLVQTLDTEERDIKGAENAGRAPIPPPPLHTDPSSHSNTSGAEPVSAAYGSSLSPPPLERAMPQMQSSYASVPPPQSHSIEDATGRHTINQAIKWAVNNRYMTLDELSDYSPDELVKRAMSILDIMPEEEKRNLGKELSDMNTR